MRISLHTLAGPLRYTAFLALLTLAAACGGGGGSQTPSTPTTPTPAPPANRNPAISSMSVNPLFGIAGLTSFALSATASDPDGDAVTVTWDFGDGSTGTGAAFSKTYSDTGIATVRATASDGRGGTVSDSRTLTVGSFAGRWSGIWSSYAFVMDLTQTGTVITGTYSDRDGAGRTDPAQPGNATGGGAMTVRMKQGNFGDFTFTGQMEQSGRRVTGTVAGSGIAGTASFTMDKQ